MTAPQPVPPCCQRGFTLSEMLLAMLICGVVLLGVAQFFPRLFQQSRQLQQQNLLTQELRQLMLVLEKNLRRAGFCQQSPCAGRGVTVSDQGRCLILRLQERRYPADGRPGGLANESYGYRWRDGSIETQRGVQHCRETGWERLTDPATLRVDALRFESQLPRVGIYLRISSGSGVTVSRQHWLLAENL